MGKSSEWYKEFFGKLYGRVLAGQFQPQRNQKQAHLIKRLLKLRKGQSVLDCPCGMGRVTVLLARLGLRMTGVDLSGLYLSRARREAKRARKNIRFLRSDMRKLPFEGQFGAVINWFTSFGYFDDAGNLATARTALAALKPGGQFLIEMLNKSWVLSNFRADHDETICGVRIISHARLDKRKSRIHNIWKMSSGSLRRTYRFSHCLYTGGELRALLRKAGFTDIRFFGHSQNGVERFTRHSRRFIVIARRPIASTR